MPKTDRWGKPMGPRPRYANRSRMTHATRMLYTTMVEWGLGWRMLDYMSLVADGVAKSYVGLQIVQNRTQRDVIPVEDVGAVYAQNVTFPDAVSHWIGHAPQLRQISMFMCDIGVLPLRGPMLNVSRHSTLGGRRA